MYRSLRTLHKWIGLSACLFLAVISFTGFLLAIKKRAEWLQPATHEGGAVNGPSEVIGMDAMFETARREGGEGFQSFEKLDRVDYRPDKNVFKVRSEDGLSEVQVDGKTGEVLSVAPRRDQLMENIHDMNFFSPLMNAWVLPLVALFLFTLSVSGCVIFFVPVVRRWRYRRSGSATGRSGSAG